MMEKGLILVADDAPVIRNIIKVAIQDRFDVLEAGNGDEAVSKLQEVNYNVDGMFLDLVMPGSDGYKVLETLKTNGIIIPTTVISGDDSRDTVERVCNNYNANYISKPLSRSQINSACDNMVSSKKMNEVSSYQRIA